MSEPVIKNREEPTCADCQHLRLCQADYYGGSLQEGACIAFEPTRPTKAHDLRSE